MNILNKTILIVILIFLTISLQPAYCEINWITSQTIEQKVMPPEDITDNEMFGSSVAITENYAIVGVKRDNNKAGSAYILEKNETKWSIIQKIESDTPTKSAYMGISVALKDKYAFIAEYSFDLDDEHKDVGTIYVYQRQSTGVWIKIQKLLPDPIDETAFFGSSMEIFNNTLIIGAYGNSKKMGKIFLFQQSGDQWIQFQCLEANDPISLNRFGNAVSLSDNYIIVGAYIENNKETGGAAYIFEKKDEVWEQSAKLLSPENLGYLYFGWTVKINDQYAFVGARGSKINDINNSGAVYIYKRSDKNWNFLYKIHENNPFENDKFGYSLDLNDDILAVGAPKNDSPDDSGTVYFYKLDASNITKIKELRASDPQMDGNYGQSIALNDNHIIIGSDIVNDLGDDLGDVTGAVYFYNPARRHLLGPDRAVSIDDAMFLLKWFSTP
jgi:hypothetical protein